MSRPDRDGVRVLTAFPIPMRGNEGESVDEALSNHGFPIPMRGNELDGGPAPDGAAWRFQSP